MNSPLWSALEAFSFDSPGASFRFSGRLRRENGWTLEFTNRVLEEYRRFLYLCVEAGHPVTPSDAVDQAWHLHLCYTRSYWEDLCRDTIGQPIHHGPTRGGKEEAEKFADWYEATIHSYTTHFGNHPPGDIWPSAPERFRRAEWVRVDKSRNLLIPAHAFRLALLCSVVALTTVGCKIGSVQVATGFVIIAMICIIIALFSRPWKGGGGKGGGGKGGGSCGGGGTGGCGGDHSGCGGGCGGGCGS